MLGGGSYLSKHCFYKAGLEEGECNEWESPGELVRYRVYKSGLLDGEYKDWNDNGLL